MNDLNDFVVGLGARRQVVVQNPNSTPGVYPDLLHNLPSLSDDGAGLAAVGEQPAGNHPISNVGSVGLGGDVEDLLEDLEQRLLRLRDLAVAVELGDDEDDPLGGFGRGVLDSDPGAGELLERLDDGAGLADEAADAGRVAEEAESHVAGGLGARGGSIRVIRVGHRSALSLPRFAL